MKRTNNFWLSALFYLEEKKVYYLDNIKNDRTRRNTKGVLKLHSKTINRLSRSFKPEVEFNFNKELKMIRKAFNIDEVNNSEWIFILQESQQRVLSMIDCNDFAHLFKRNLKWCMEEGERFNNWMRDHLTKSIDELRAVFSVDIATKKAQLKSMDKRTKKAKKIQSEIIELESQHESIAEYTECADEAADLVLVLFLKCKEK